ncbi:MAG: hypothetical protein HQ568_00165, partial [Calditrichaeota bacterium]|nr:hypothetical protein [Calditrichota bacterium]
MNFMIRPSATILFAVSVLFLANCAERNPTQIPNDEGPELKLVSQTQTPGLARGVTLAADKLYIADDARGVIVGDVSNLSSPTWVDTIKTISGATNVKYAHESNVLIIQETQYITAI